MKKIFLLAMVLAAGLTTAACDDETNINPAPHDAGPEAGEGGAAEAGTDAATEGGTDAGADAPADAAADG